MFPDIPTGIFKNFNDTIDNFWAKPLIFVYPEIRQDCPNCISNGAGSIGIYRSGGEYPFDNGSICPMCDGQGYRMIESTENGKARMYYDKKYWTNLNLPININNAVAQMIFTTDDLPKIQKCKFIIPLYYPNMNALQGQKLFLIGSPYPQGFTQNPKKYVVTYWGSNV